MIANKPIFLDGGMGQELVRRMTTPPTPLWSTQILLDAPHLVQELHLEFILAGCRVITLNNYALTPQRLARHGMGEQLEKLHQSAIKIAQEAILCADQEHNIKDIKIAACLPPLAASYQQDSVPTYQEALKSYAQLVAIQKEAADIILIETMSNLIEAEAAIVAAQETNLPIWCAFCLDNDRDDGALPSGALLSDAIELAHSYQIDAVLLNCTRAEIIAQNLTSLTKFQGQTGIYPNAFKNTKDLKTGGTVDSLAKREDFGIKEFVDFMYNAYHNHAIDILGGCCEISPKHLHSLIERFNQKT